MIDANASGVLEALAHRGPDAQTSLLLDAGVRLFHTRLAIQGLVGGDQPMRRGPLVIAYNGEIYNHHSLRRRFALDCAGSSDTETVLALYEKLGEGMLPELDGMFAFALVDERENTLLLARDRLGEKPLYLHAGNGHIAFASELNALGVLAPLEVDSSAVAEALHCGFHFGEATPYRHVREVQPGELLRIDLETRQFVSKRWFTLLSELENKAEEAATLDEIEQALDAAVARTVTTAEVDVGCFLSGGLDSGLVTAFASRHAPGLRTFTVAFDDQFDESPLAAEVAARYGTRHQCLRVDYASLSNDIETILAQYGEPIYDDSIIPSWYVCKAAAEHVSVVLTGDGADEQFGGYRRYVPYARLPLFGGGGVSRLLSSFAEHLPPPAQKRGAYAFAWRLMRLLGKSGVERYLAATTDYPSGHLLSSAPDAALVDQFETIRSLPYSHLRKLMLMDAMTLLPSALLPKMDIAAMAHSLETRSPFLARDVIATSVRLPDRLIVHHGTTKVALRALARKHLPESVASGAKQGFGVPLEKWVDGRLREPIHDLLDVPSPLVAEYCRNGTIPSLLAGKGRMPSHARARALWALFVTESFLRRQRSHATCRSSVSVACEESPPSVSTSATRMLS